MLGGCLSGPGAAVLLAHHGHAGVLHRARPWGGVMVAAIVGSLEVWMKQALKRVLWVVVVVVGALVGMALRQSFY